MEASSEGGRGPDGAVASWMECLHSATLQPTTQNLQSLMFTNTSADTDANLPTGEHRYLFLLCYQKFYIPTVTLLLYHLIPTYASRT